MANTLRAAIVGPGNIGSDLLFKALRSELIEPVFMVGVLPDSPGLARAREFGLETTVEGVPGLIPHVKDAGISLAFDATSARVHPENARALNEAGVRVIDLTPAAIGPYCVPPVNLHDLDPDVQNVNMVSCGGQATIPIVHAVSRVQTVEYAEIVATVASVSVGLGTRQNIDEFTRTTALGVEQVGGAKRGKAIIIINPADPPLIMRDTIYCLLADDPDRDAIRDSVERMIEDVQRYVPGYRLTHGPLFEDRRVSVFLEIEGRGDFLPKYAGNLDIMTAAAVRTAELFAGRGEEAGG